MHFFDFIGVIDYLLKVNTSHIVSQDSRKSLGPARHDIGLGHGLSLSLAFLQDLDIVYLILELCLK